MITFNRNDVATLAEVRHLGRLMDWRTTDWRRIARKLAERYGFCTIFRCDDTMVVFEKIDGKVCQRSYRPGSWRFE